MSKRLFALSIIILICVTASAVLWMRNKLTYLEYSDINRNADTFITVNANHDVLVQDFFMPYDIMQGLSLKIGTFSRENNSEWDVSLLNPGDSTVLYKKHFNASLLKDNGDYYIEFSKKLRLTKNKKYQVKISPTDVNADTSLAYYVSNGAKDSLNLSFNGRNYGGTLCLRIYGGDTDFWWSGFIIFIAIIFFQFFARIYYLTEVKKTNWSHDLSVQSYIVGIVSFLMLFSFCVTWQFMDEIDNMKGGLVIANGGVLYRDYVTQHTPFVYYLCGIFALLGAKSVEQFRLLYYIFEAVIWGLLYKRHKNQFGYKMLLLPVLEIIIVTSVTPAIPQSGSMIMSDGVQGLCFVVLLLELFKYIQTKSMNWDGAIIISACFWGSIGSAFLSAYTLVWFVLAFFVIGIKRSVSGGASLVKFINCNWKLLTALVIPLIALVAYFALSHSMIRAFDQFYSFNREIYSKYTGGFGTNVIAPFIYSFRNLFDTIVNNFNSLMNAHATTIIVLQTIVLVTVLSILTCMLRKGQYIKSAFLFTVLCCAGVRGYDFHGIAAWYVAVMIIALYYREILDYIPKFGTPALAVVMVYSLTLYVHTVGDNLLYEQKPVSDLNLFLVSASHEHDNFIMDAGMSDTLYMTYKHRNVVNRVPYILPWYTDWYEQDLVDDLLERKPLYVVFNEDSDVWGHKYFARSFIKTLKQHYTRLSDNSADGWRYFVWKLN